MPSLFGINNSNRNFSDPYYWGKNQFNSAFPVALTCYMQSQKKSLVYVKYLDERQTEITEIGVDEVFGKYDDGGERHFSFESRYDRFKDFVHDELAPIDLVVCRSSPDKQIKPLEIKLTTLPDNATEGLSEDKYGAELVIRSATTRYMPCIRKDEIKNIVLGGGQKFLSPERRFDAILYFSADIFEGAQ